MLTSLTVCRLRRGLLLSLLLVTLSVHAADGRLGGLVTDAATGRPLASVAITLHKGDEAITISSDNEGRYLSPAIDEGLVDIEATLTGYRTVAEPSFRVIGGKTTLLDISLQRLSPALEEIVVTARARPGSPYAGVAATTLSREEIRRAPGTAGDVFRGLGSLPGVTTTGEFSDFTVRGRGPRDNLILIDGIPYDRLVHFDESLGEEDDLEGGGRFSIFGQNVIGEADFQPGGWEAAYGGANGSLLRLGLADGNPDSAFTSAKIDLAGGELLYDGPSGIREDTTALVSLRHYNFGWLFETIGEEDIGTPKLTDVILKTTSRPDARTTLRLLALYTPERYTRTAKNVLASEDFRDAEIQQSRQDAGLLGATLERLIGDNGRLVNTLYYRRAEDDNALGESYPERSPDPLTVDNLVTEADIITLNEEESELGWRLDYGQGNRFGEFSLGLRLSRMDIDYRREVSRNYPVFIYDANDVRPDPAQRYVLLTPSIYDTTLSESAWRGAVYLDQVFEAGAVTIRPGLRLDHDGLLDSTTVSPRLQAGWQLSGTTRLTFTAGAYYQPPRLLEIAANSANIALRPERTLQASAGIEHYLGDDWRMLIEGYYQNLDNLIIESEQASGLLSNDGEGYGTGLDWMLSRRFVNGWSAGLRYSYNHTRIDSGDIRGSLPAEFNRPHLANFTVSYEPNDRWAYSARYQIASGRPADEYVIHADVLNDPAQLRYAREITLRNSGRLPSFQTLNVRVDYRRNFSRLNIIGFIDIINVLGRTNVDEVDFSPRTGTVETDGLDTFPQLGLTLEF